jgi:hypothetical protein
VAKQVNRIDIYKQAATAAGVALPKSDMRSHKLIDGVVWDGKDPKKYAASFKVMPDRLSGMEKENAHECPGIETGRSAGKGGARGQTARRSSYGSAPCNRACPQRGIPGGQSPSEQASPPPVREGLGGAGAQ